ncbi:MAG: hypothetical protein WGN25_14965 [Candidatus Electrothrix sp. GW3-4]|uniref:hypothetical protein n=1 Tax=Candidatus Electrothrix sp. GW3-4 TaxID=3126740 RepID=UPI0030D39F48
MKHFPTRKENLPLTLLLVGYFSFFSGIHLLLVGGMQQLVLNLNEHHLRLLKLLGGRYEKLYSGNG